MLKYSHANEHRQNTLSFTIFLQSFRNLMRLPWEDERESTPAGMRRKWGLSFMSPRQLLNYPLLFDLQSEVWSDNNKIIDTVSYGLPTLGQIIQGVLWELSYFGTGDDRQEKEQEFANMFEEDSQ